MDCEPPKRAVDRRWLLSRLAAVYVFATTLSTVGLGAWLITEGLRRANTTFVERLAIPWRVLAQVPASSFSFLPCWCEVP
jgi:hypothetical protein